MFIDQLFAWEPSPGASLSGAGTTTSTNITDLGSSTYLFQGGGRSIKVKGYLSSIVLGTNTTVRVTLYGADSSDLSTNPIILADTGVSRVLVSGDNGLYDFEMMPMEQLDKKRYYGLKYVIGGTGSPTATVVAVGVIDAQSAGVKQGGGANT